MYQCILNSLLLNDWSKVTYWQGYCSPVLFYSKVSTGFLRQDSQSSCSFGKFQNLEISELYCSIFHYYRCSFYSYIVELQKCSYFDCTYICLEVYQETNDNKMKKLEEAIKKMNETHGTETDNRNKEYHKMKGKLRERKTLSWRVNFRLDGNSEYDNEAWADTEKILKGTLRETRHWQRKNWKTVQSRQTYRINLHLYRCK